MKKIIPSILITALASSSLLFAQVENRLEETKEIVSSNSSTNYELPTTNCNNQGHDLDCYLMMDPAELKNIEEGTKAVGEALGILGKEEIITAEGAGKGDIVNAVSSSNVSHQVLRLRGGGPKQKNKSTGGLKSTGESSDEENDPDLESEDTQAMGSEVSKYLKKEIINNIYTECLAEVAKLSLGGRVTAASASKEEAEWAAAAQAAEYSKGKIERAFEKAEREIDEAKSTSDEAKRNVRELEKAPKPVSAAEQAIAAANLAYEKAYAAHAASDYKAKKLIGELAEARVETANAVLHAITVRKGTQHATEAEAGLEIAKEAEVEALRAVEVAKADVAAKAALVSSAELNLNDAKKTAIGTSGTNPAPPMTAAQRVAMREIEEDKAIAEAAKSKAKKVELTANVAKGKVHEMNFERELKAYHDAEEAWIEAVEGYKTALAKVKDAELNDEELEAALASAEVHQATWRAHARWVKARQADQIIVSSGASLDQLTVAEIAWANVVEGYNMAIEKAMQTKLKCVELTDSLNNALSAQESAQAEAIAFLQTKEIQAREQATTAKIASRTALDNNHCVESDDWNRVVVQAEQAAKNWQKVRETLAQGKLERAAFWRKAAEQSEISAEEWRQYIIQIRTFGNKYTEEEENTFVCQRKAAFITCCLSNDTTSKARFEEATNEGNQFLADLWSKSAEQNQQFAKYLRKGRDCYTGEPLEGAALALEKTTIAIENKNEPLAMLWSKVVTRYQESIEHFCNEAEAELKGNDENATSWNNVGCSIVESAWMLGLASEAVEKEVIAKADKNKLLAELWSKSAAQYQEVAEHYRKVAEAKLNKNNVEVDFLGKVIFSAKDSAFRLKSAAEALEKAVEATAKGNQPLAELWNKTAAQYQKTAEHYQKMVEAKLNRNDVETDHWEKLAVFAEDSASQLNSASKALEEATTAKMKGNQLLAELWSKTAMQYQEIVELVRKAAEVKSNENDEEEDRWGKIADFAKDSVYQLESASRALEEATTAKMKGNQLIAELWSKTAVQCQETAEYKRKAAEAKLNGNDEGADYWEEVASFAVSAALRLNSAAEAVGKAAAVTTKGNQALAELWSKTAVQNQEIAEYDQKAAGARLSGNNSEVVRWRELASSANQAFGLELAAEALEKATETTAEGNQALTELWSKSAVQNQESVEFFRKAAEARLIENDSEVDRWQKMAHSAYQSAVALDKKAKKLAKKKCEK